MYNFAKFWALNFKFHEKRQLKTSKSLHSDRYSNETSFSLQLAEIKPTFLEKEVLEWSQDASYIALGKILSGMTSVNDGSERGVKLTTDYCNALTKENKQRQNVMQVVEKHRTEFPVATRKAFDKK